MPLGFLVPAFLAGLAAVLVPLLLHLRRRDRRRPRPFPSLMFLERLPVQTDQKRRITDWPLLLLRALAVALLVAAFARPFLNDPDALVAPDAGLTVLMVDRSASIGAAGSDAALRDSLAAVIDRTPSSRRLALVAFDASATVLVQPTGDHAAVRAALDHLPEPAGATRFSAALRAASQLLVAERLPGEVVLISDLQQSGVATGAAPGLPAGTSVVTVAVEPDDRDNTTVTALEVEQVPAGDNGRRALIAARLARFGGDAPRNVAVTLDVDGRMVASQTISLAPDAVERVTFDTVSLSRSAVRIAARLSGDGLPADDVHHVIVPQEAVNRVLLVTARDARPDEHRFVLQALAIGRDPAFEATRTTTLDPEQLRQAAVVMLVDVIPSETAIREALDTWVQGGGGLIVVPGDRIASRRNDLNGLPASIDGSRERRDGAMLGAVEHSHPALSGFRGEGVGGLSRVRVRRHAELEPVAGGDVLLRFDDGTPALVAGSSGEGRIAVVGVPLDGRRGDFPLQPGFLPFVRGLAGWAAGADGEVLSRVSGSAWLAPATVREPVLRSPSGDLIRPVAASRSITLRENGVYDLFDGGTAGLPVASVAVNGVAAESDLRAVPPEQVMLGVTDLPAGATVPTADAAVASESSQQWWRWVLLILFLLLVAEGVMASSGWRGVGADPILEGKGQEA